MPWHAMRRKSCLGRQDIHPCIDNRRSSGFGTEVHSKSRSWSRVLHTLIELFAEVPTYPASLASSFLSSLVLKTLPLPAVLGQLISQALAEKVSRSD